ncbi:hypothetical protein [Rubrolithibacter danxiaensis]|uniref:hypothetical protein n=1 Tax=Rubrolithibacter danxiaensis TaxID=3390805 RepID=UPI003BF8C06C
MKIFTIFMALLILAMGVNLCRDKDFCDGKETTTLSKTGKEEPAKSGSCSPFCHCTRCSFSILLPKSLTGTRTQFLTLRTIFISSESIAAGINSAIWQPPKFA